MSKRKAVKTLKSHYAAEGIPSVPKGADFRSKDFCCDSISTEFFGSRSLKNF